MLSLGIVPVGLTAHREGLEALRPFERVEVEILVKNVGDFQERQLAEGEDPWLYLADEFYAGFASNCRGRRRTGITRSSKMVSVSRGFFSTISKWRWMTKFR